MESNINGQEPRRSFFGRLRRGGAWILRTACRDKVATAVVLGFVVGIMLKFTVELSRLHKFAIRYSGELLLKGLHVWTTPLVVTGVIAGVGRLKLGFSARLASRASAYVACTTILSVLLALTLAMSIQPGVDFDQKKAPKDVQILHLVDAVVDLVRTVIPPNPIQGLFHKHKTVRFEVKADEQNSSLQPNAVQIERFHIQGTNIVGLIVWSGMVGHWLDRMEERGEDLLEDLASLNEVTHIVAHWILCLLPLAIGFMVPGIVVQTDDWDMAFKLGQFIAVVVLGLIINGFVVLPAIYLLVQRRNPFVLIKEMLPRLKTAFFTPSSPASHVNGNGTIIYQVVAAIFIAQIHHVDWDLGTILVIALGSAVPGVEGPGIPAGGAVAVFFVLAVVNLPANAACLLVPVHYLLNRLNTVVDVMGDCVGEALKHAALEGEQEMEV